MKKATLFLVALLVFVTCAVPLFSQTAQEPVAAADAAKPVMIVAGASKAVGVMALELGLIALGVAVIAAVRLAEFSSLFSLRAFEVDQVKISGVPKRTSPTGRKAKTKTAPTVTTEKVRKKPGPKPKTAIAAPATK